MEWTKAHYILSYVYRVRLNGVVAFEDTASFHEIMDLIRVLAGDLERRLGGCHMYDGLRLVCSRTNGF